MQERQASVSLQVKQFADQYQAQLEQYIQPILNQLTEQLDTRLVRTFLGVVQCLIRFRHNRQGLLLTQLGEYLLSPLQGPAGTKRISNLLRNQDWDHQLIEDCLLEKAITQAQHWRKEGKQVFALWDDSVVEKHETLKNKHLCAVRSSKAKRLTRIRPGFYQKCCQKTIHVAGLQWSAILLTTLTNTPCLALFRFWTSRGKHATEQKIVHHKLLTTLKEKLADAITYVLDRGFGNSVFVGQLLGKQLHFLVRWRSSYQLVNAKGELKKAYLHSVGKKAMHQKEFTDRTTRNIYTLKLLYSTVTLPNLPETKLTLLVCRRKRKGQPWYLLTDHIIANEQQAWNMIAAYQKRWQIEECFRFSKSELAMESPRLWLWENRLKLMMMVALVYGFLLSILKLDTQKLLLRFGSHRTGKRYKYVFVPLYRTRMALAFLFQLLYTLNLVNTLKFVDLNSG
jgi:Transposase DDE domain